MPAQLTLFGGPTRPTPTASWQRRRPEQGVLYDVVRAELETFLSLANTRGQNIPRFVERELRSYLECGLLCYGFLRVRCDDCGFDRLVAFSCKGRGFCPSCAGRRMAGTAAHLVDRVLPEVPVRQWVVSFPWAVRYALAYDRVLCSAVLRLVIRTIFSSLRKRARSRLGPKAETAQCGAVTFVQRFGGALNLNLHFHSLVLDGVYLSDPASGRVRFQVLPPPDDVEIEHLTATLARRLQRLLERRGLFENSELEDDSPLPQLAAASVRGRIATGPRAGHRVLRLGDHIDAEGLRDATGPRCANIGGVSLHANVAVPAHDRKRLERLCRYVARPPISTERLSRLPDGRLAYWLKRRWRDGTTHVVFDPLELVEKLAALIPPPRAHLVRYHGVLAPAARSRKSIVPAHTHQESATFPQGATPTLPLPSPEQQALPQVPASSTGASPLSASRDRRPVCASGLAFRTPANARTPDPNPAGPRHRRLSWAELMRRVFRTDVLCCPSCHGRMRVLAVVEQPVVINRILTHLGLPARAPPVLPPRRDLLESLEPENQF